MALVSGSMYTHYSEPVSIRRESINQLMRQATANGYAVIGVVNSQCQVVIRDDFTTEQDAIDYVNTDPDGYLS